MQQFGDGCAVEGGRENVATEQHWDDRAIKTGADAAVARYLGDACSVKGGEDPVTAWPLSFSHQ